jgi:hypothetical protein
VHAADPLGTVDAGGDRRDREGRGVGREDRFGAAHVRELREQPPLQLQVLRCRFDDELAFRQILDAARRVQSRARGIRLRLAPRSPRYALVEAGGHACFTRGECLGDGVVHPGLEAPDAGQLRDTRAHRPGTHDADEPDSQSPVPGGSSPSQ